MRFALIFACLTGTAIQAQESTDTIRIALTDRTASQIAAVLMGSVLTEGGYSVDYVRTTGMDQFTGLGDGSIDLAMGVSEAMFLPQLDAAEAAGSIEKLSPSGLISTEDWWIPAYAQATCPYLPDWLDLQDPACAVALSGDPTRSTGLILLGPEHWGGDDVARLAALELPMELRRFGSEAELWAAIDAAYQAQVPVIASVPGSSWVYVEYPGMYLGLPVWEPACYSDPAWGPNPDATGDCGAPWGGSWNIVATGFGENWAGAAAAVSAFNIPGFDMVDLTSQVDRDGMTVEDAVAGWMDANADTWRGWIGQ